METRLIARLAAAALTLAVPAAAASANVAPGGKDAVEAIRAEMIRDPVQAIAAAQALVTRAPRLPEKERASIGLTARWLLGEAYARTGDLGRALDTLTQARDLARRVTPASQIAADIELSLGDVLTDRGEITRALPTLQRAHAAFVALRDPRGSTKSLILIALLYNRARDYRTALRYFEQAASTAAADPSLGIAVHNGRGLAFMELRRFAAAEAEFQRAVGLARRVGSPIFLVSALGNLANARVAEGRLDQASGAVSAGLAIADREEGADKPWLIAVAAKIAAQRGQDAVAHRLVEQLFDGVDLTTTSLPDRDAHETAYRIYMRDGESALALEHLRALKRLDDQATEIARSSSAALAAARFDYANQELRIARLKAADLQKSVAFERAASRTQRNVFLGIAGTTLLVIGLLAFGIVVLRRSRNQVRAANADLAASNGALGHALAVKTEFLATTSHEIRTPLNGILGMTQVLIADPKLDPATRERLEVVQGAGVTMRALVDDILDVAKIESGKMTIEDAPFDPARCLTDACRLWEDQARAKGLSFTLDIGALPPQIRGDAARMRQIVFNLLSNAVKFTPSGSVGVHARHRDARLCITVSDSGIGISPSARETIFESFRQADAGTTRQFGGTGLGLSICRNLARAMGGDVTLESVEGSGSRFTLDLPVIETSDVPEVSAPCGLLIVDPNPISRAMLETLFEGVEGVTSVADEAAALAVASVKPPSRVLADSAAASLLPELRQVAPEARIFLLMPPGSACDPTPGTTTVQRPIAKKALVATVLDAADAGTPMLVRQAA